MLELKKILAKNPAELNDEEKSFLRENVSKLSDAEKEKFAGALEVGDEGEGVELEKVIKAIAGGLEKQVETIAAGIVGRFTDSLAAARQKALGGETMNANKKADDKTRAFLKALFAGDKAAAKALTTNPEVGSSPDDAAAGLLVPDELRAEVLRIAETQYGLARRDMLYLPFSGPGNSRKVPALGTSVTVTWTGETVTKTSTQPGFRIVEQTLKKLAAIVPMTEEIIEDSAINITQLVAALFAEAVAKEEDLQFFAGTGSPWTGILNNGNVNKVYQIAGGVKNLTADDLLNLIDEIPSGALPGAKFYLNRTVLSVVRKLKDKASGQYIFQNPGQSLPATIWNYPYELTDALPTAKNVGAGENYIIFGNLKQSCIFGDKQQLRTTLLTEATITDTDGSTPINLAEQDMVALRIVERVGYVIGLPKAIAVLNSGEAESS